MENSKLQRIARMINQELNGDHGNKAFALIVFASKPGEETTCTGNAERQNVIKGLKEFTKETERFSAPIMSIPSRLKM